MRSDAARRNFRSSDAAIERGELIFDDLILIEDVGKSFRCALCGCYSQNRNRTESIVNAAAHLWVAHDDAEYTRDLLNDYDNYKKGLTDAGSATVGSDEG